MTDYSPNWRRRYLLNIDRIVRMFCYYTNKDYSEIWHPELYNKVFLKDKFNKMVLSEYHLN